MAAVLAAVVGDTAEDETTEGNLLEFLVCYNGTGPPSRKATEGQGGEYFGLRKHTI